MRKVRWGILGAAKIAREWIIPAIQLSRDGVVAALASRDSAKGDTERARFNIAHSHDSYESLLGSSEVDAVYIPLPNTLHVEWTLKAIAAGKHVLCEKPLAMRAEDIDQLIAARDKSKLVAGEAFMVVHHPQWRKVRALLAEGKIGRLRMVQGCFTYNNKDPNNIRNRKELGGGALRDIGVYPLVVTRFATGQEPKHAVARIELDPAFGTDRFAACSLDFDDFLLSFYCGTQAARRQQMTFHGDLGWLQLDTPFNANVYDMARIKFRANESEVYEETIFPGANHYQLLIENFNAAVLGQAPLEFPLEGSRANQRGIDMIFAAAAAPARP
jgi:predicted dehydrogenase